MGKNLVCLITENGIVLKTEQEFLDFRNNISDEYTAFLGQSLVMAMVFYRLWNVLPPIVDMGADRKLYELSLEDLRLSEQDIADGIKAAIGYISGKRFVDELIYRNETTVRNMPLSKQREWMKILSIKDLDL
jgi:hypothetical protein